MKGKIPILLSSMIILFGFGVFAQQPGNVGIGILTPNAKARLHVEANDMGVIIPRMTTSERIAIAPNGQGDAGLIVYDENDNLFYYWNSNQWMPYPNNTIVNDNDWTVNGANLYPAVSGNVGIGTTLPSAKLHVNGTLRFAGLNTALDNTVLIIDANGNISIRTLNPNIWDGDDVNDADSNPTNEYNTNFSFNSATNTLTITDAGTTYNVDLSTLAGGVGPDNDWTVNGLNLYPAVSGNVGIGTAAPTAKLHVSGTLRFAGLNSGSNNTVLIIDANGNVSKRALNSNIWDGDDVNDADSNPANEYNTSFSFNSATNTLNIADAGTSYNVNLSTLAGADNDWTISGNNMYSGVSGNIGLGTTSPSYKLHVIGQIKTDGVTETSDVRLKREIITLEQSLEKVLAMRGVSYYWKTSTGKPYNVLQIGLVAQEVEQILPEIVNTDADGYKSIQYSNLVAVLIEAVKTQQQQINNLETKLAHQSEIIENIDWVKLEELIKVMNLEAKK